MHLPIIKSASACALLLSLFTGIGSAQIMTETFHDVSVLTSAQDFQNFTLPDFNTNLGTLEKINVTFVVMEKAQVRVFNTSTSPLGFTNASVTSGFTLAGPGEAKYSGLLTATLASGVADPGMNTFPNVTNWNKSMVKVDSANFGLWENQPNDTVSFTFSRGTSSYAGTGSDKLFFGGSSKLRERTIVRYTYLAVPEPSQKYLVSLVALAMLALWIGRERFGRQAKDRLLS